MAIVELDDMKAHLGVTSDEDDVLIDGKIKAAQAHIERLLGFKIAIMFPDEIPADLIEAVRQLTAHFYENREATLVGVTAQVLPLGVADIVAEHRIYTYG